MPSVSKKQHNFMEAVAHNAKFAKKVGIPRSVGEDFSKADKGKTFKKGREMKMKETMGPKSMSKDVEKGSNKLGKFGESKVQKRGHTKGMNLGDSGKKEPIESEKNMKAFEKEGMKKGGKVKKYAKGGTIIGETMGSMGLKKGNKSFGEHAIQERGHTRGKNV